MESSSKDAIKDIRFSDLFKLEDIQRIQDLFSEVHGVASVIVDTEGRPLTVPSAHCDLCAHIIKKTKKGQLNCIKAEVLLKQQNTKGPTIISCLSGELWDASASISVHNQHIANWNIGPVRSDSFSVEKIFNYADSIGADKDAYLKSYLEIPVMPVEKFRTITEMLFVLSNELSEKAASNLSLKNQVQEKDTLLRLLQQSEERYKLLFEGNHSVMLIIHPETGDIWDANISASKFYGWSREDLCKMNISHINILSPDEVKQAMKTSLTEKKNIFHFKHRLASGEIKDVEVFSGPVTINDTTFLYSTINDITQRTKAEDNLKESEERWKYALEGSTDGVWDWNVLTSKVFYSAQWKAMLGYEESEIGDGLEEWSKRVHLDDLETTLADVEKHLKGETPHYKNEHRVICKDGSYKWILDEGKVVERDIEGKPLRAIGTHKDITTRKLAEKAVAESESLYRSILNASPDIITITNLEGFILISSPKAMDFFREPDPAKLKNRNLLDFIIPEDHQRAITNITKLIEGNYYKADEYTALRSDGSTFEIEVNGDFIRDSEGKPVNIVFITRDISERKAAEKKLLKSEERFRVLVESINDVIYEISDTGEIKYVSPSVKNVLGYTPDELTGRNLFTLLHEEDKAHILDKLQNLDKRDYPYYEYRFITKEGGICWVRSSTTPLYENGIIVGGIGSMTDITERKLAEEELRKLSRAVEQSPVSIVITDIEGNIEYANPKATETTGYSLEELKGQNPRVLKSGDTNDQEYTDLWNKISNGQEWHGLFHNKKKNGDLYWESSTISPISNKKGEITHYIAIKEDITERRNTEIALKMSEERFRQVVEQSMEVVWEVDSTGLYTYVSPMSVEVYGRTPEEMVGKLHFYDLHPEKDRECLKEQSQLIISKKEKFTDFISFIIKPDGSQVFLSTNGVPLLNEQGELLGYRGINTDITERKLAEEAIKDQNDRLNAIVSAFPDLIFVIDHTGIYREVYAAQPQTLLLPKEAIIGKNIKDIFPAESAELHLIKMQECLHERKLISYNYSLENETFLSYFEARLVPFGDNKVLATVRDITEAKLRDNELKKLSQAVEQSPVSIVMTDLKANIEYINPAFEKSTAYCFEELIGSNTNILKSGKTDDKVYRQMWETITKGEKWEGEWINKRKNGELFWESITISPILDGNGNITNYLAVKQDITQRKNDEQEIHELNATLESKIKERTSELAETNCSLVQEIEERKRIEKALSESENSYRTVVENVKEVIFKTDTEGLWLFLNKAWEEVTGYTVDESLGTLFVTYVHPDDRQRNMELFEPLISREKEYCKHQVRYLTKNGGYRWVEVYARLGLNDKDEIIGTYGTLSDITENKRAADFENELLKLTPNLTGVSGDEIITAINLALSRIGQFLGADRSYVFELNDDAQTLSNTYEWCNEGISSEMENLQNLPVSFFEYWMKVLNKLENIIIPSVEDLPENWKEVKESLQNQNIKSLIAIPMLSENKLIGFVGLDSVIEKREYNSSEINILKVWSGMLTSLINNYKTQRLVEQTRANYETFFNTIDDFLFVLNQEGNIIHTNDTVINRLGYRAEELLGQTVLMVHPEERREEAGRIVGEMLEGVTEYCPVPLRTKTGNYLPVETKVKPGFWDGKPVIFGVSKDMTKVQLSEEKFAKAFQSSTAVMAISLVEEATYLEVNDAFIRILGYSKSEVIGKSPFELNLYVDLNLRNEIIQRLKENIKVSEVEIEVRNKAGEIITGLFSADFIHIGNELCLLTVMVDISERKKAEKAIVLARNEAEQANMAKSEFLSRMSHELRTPMNSILGFAQLLEMGELNPGQHKGVTHIMRSGKHLLHLINEVLDISRIEAGRMSLSIEAVQVKNCILEVIDIIQPMANQRLIKIELEETSANTLYILSDKQRIKQVLLNILNNAVKYNHDAGYVYIKAEQRTDTQGHNTVRILITDSGVGILPEDIHKIFSPFERIGAERSTTEGSGLGLAVVRKLMDVMGGLVGVESEAGIGSTFWIELPQTDSQLDSIDKMAGFTLSDDSNLNQTGNILYIEDNVSNIELVEQILMIQRPNINLISCLSGIEGFDIAVEKLPDLILLDLNLPDIHGSEVLKYLLKNDRTKNIPVIIVSADAMPLQLDRLLKAGARNYLTKPIDVIVFLRLIDDCLFSKNVN